MAASFQFNILIQSRRLKIEKNQIFCKYFALGYIESCFGEALAEFPALPIYDLGQGYIGEGVSVCVNNVMSSVILIKY